MKNIPPSTDFAAEFESLEALERREYITDEQGRVTIKGLPGLTFARCRDAELFALRVLHRYHAASARQIPNSRVEEIKKMKSRTLTVIWDALIAQAQGKPCECRTGVTCWSCIARIERLTA